MDKEYMELLDRLSEHIRTIKNAKSNKAKKILQFTELDEEILIMSEKYRELLLYFFMKIIIATKLFPYQLQDKRPPRKYVEEAINVLEKLIEGMKQGDKDKILEAILDALSIFLTKTEDKT